MCCIVGACEKYYWKCDSLEVMNQNMVTIYWSHVSTEGLCSSKALQLARPLVICGLEKLIQLFILINAKVACSLWNTVHNVFKNNTSSVNRNQSSRADVVTVPLAGQPHNQVSVLGWERDFSLHLYIRVCSGTSVVYPYWEHQAKPLSSAEYQKLMENVAVPWVPTSLWCGVKLIAEGQNTN